MSLPTLPTFAAAAASQYRYNSWYTVFLIAPDGSRVYLGMSQRKSGSGLMTFLRRDYVQAHVATLPGAEGATFTKHATELKLSNGYRIAFGGTIRQEATH